MDVLTYRIETLLIINLLLFALAIGIMFADPGRSVLGVIIWLVAYLERESLKSELRDLIIVDAFRSKDGGGQKDVEDGATGASVTLRSFRGGPGGV